MCSGCRCRFGVRLLSRLDDGLSHLSQPTHPQRSPRDNFFRWSPRGEALAFAASRRSRPLPNPDAHADERARAAYPSSVDDIHAVELAEHRNAPFPASVEKGRDYGEVDPVLIDADIFGWASQDRLDGAQKGSLRQAADELARSLDAFPADARPYYERLVRHARRAAAR